MNIGAYLIAFGIRVLGFPADDIGGVQVLTRTEGLLDAIAVQAVLELAAHEGSSLPWLHVHELCSRKEPVFSS